MLRKFSDKILPNNRKKLKNRKKKSTKYSLKIIYNFFKKTIKKYKISMKKRQKKRKISKMHKRKQKNPLINQ